MDDFDLLFLMNPKSLFVCTVTTTMNLRVAAEIPTQQIREPIGMTTG